MYAQKLLDFKYVNTDSNVADALTKPLNVDKHMAMCSLLGLVIDNIECVAAVNVTEMTKTAKVAWLYPSGKKRLLKAGEY